MRVRKVSFIIVNFNTRDLLEKCIDNLDMIYPHMEIIVVDNSSSDGSREMVKTKYADRVILIESENKGLAHGYNLGLRISTGYYICYLGTDAYPKENAFKKMINYMNHNTHAAILTPRLVLRNGSIDWDCHRGLPTPWSAITYFSGISRFFPKSKIFNSYFLGHEDMFTIHEIGACISHFMLVRRNVHDAVGFWDEDYFLYGEDIDLCFRVQQAGYKVIYMGEVEVLHYKGASVGRKESMDLQTEAVKDKVLMRRIKQETTRAMRLFYKKNYTKKYPFIVRATVVLGIYILEKFRLLAFDIKNAL